MAEEVNSIDAAISVCSTNVTTHRVLANKLLILIIGTTMSFVGLQILDIQNNRVDRKVTKDMYAQLRKDLGNYKQIYSYNDEDSLTTQRDTLDAITKHAYMKLDITSKAVSEIGEELKLDKTGGFTYFILYGIFIIVFSVLISFYRFHQKEISKYEHYLIGFHRIRIAANNSVGKFEDEVRTSLTKDAFVYESSSGLFTKYKKIESPIPGHPTSDIATYMINKIFNSIEIREKKGSR